MDPSLPDISTSQPSVPLGTTVTPETQIVTAKFSSASAVPIVPSSPQPQPPPPPASSPPPKPEKNLTQYPGHKGLFLKVLFVLLLIFIAVLGVIFYVLPMFAKKEEVVTLTYWGVLEDSNVMREFIKDFEKEHPLIKVEYLQQDQKQYLEKLSTRIQNGSGPDIYRFHNTWTVMLSPLLLPLPTTVIKPSEFKEAYFPVVQKDLSRNGAIYGIPLGFDTLALFTNTEIFQAGGATVPKTWNDFVETARSLTVKTENGQITTAGAALGNTENVTHAGEILSLLFIQNGANLLTLSASQQDVSEALQFFTNFQPEVWNASLDPSILAFSKGNLAMYIGYSWDIFAIKAQNPTLSFEVHTMPSLADRKMTIANYWAEGVSSKSLHKKEALLFMEYVAAKKNQQKFYDIASRSRLFGEPFARRDLAESLKNDTRLAPFVVSGDVAQSTYFMSDIATTGINEKANTLLFDSVKSLDTGFTQADDAAKKLTEGVQQLFLQYGL